MTTTSLTAQIQALFAARKFTEAGTRILAMTDGIQRQGMLFELYRAQDKHEETLEAGLNLAHRKLSDDQRRTLMDWAVSAGLHSLTVAAGSPLLGASATNLQFLFKLGTAAERTLDYELARMCGMQALQLADTPSQLAAVYALMGYASKGDGLITDAVSYLAKSVEADPDINRASSAIMYYAYGFENLETYYNMAEALATNWLTAERQLTTGLTPRRRPLRIGFMGGDFRLHALTMLIADVFRAFPSVSENEVFIYFNATKNDADKYTQVFEAGAKALRYIGGLSRDDACDVIVRDRIDVLVDLAGYTARGRPDILLAKPAPVQVGWISGMMTPTGLPTVPYFLTDTHMLPDFRTRERLTISLSSAFVYSPLNPQPLSTGLPADKQGSITFGQLNNPCKFTEAALDAWAAILKRVPDSRLLLKMPGKDSAQRMARRFARRDIPGSSLVFVGGQEDQSDVMHLYDSIDIALDTWPCTGCLTSFEAWYMGCPTITLVGNSFVHRQTFSMTQQLGLSHELAAYSPASYVDKAVALAENRELLRQLRITCRERLKGRPMSDGARVAKEVMAGLEACWDDWCQSRQPLQSLPSVLAM